MESIKKSFEVYDLLSEDDKTTINEIILNTVSKNFDKCKKLNYHITLSHGSKFDTFSKALELGLNYAAAFNLKKSADLPSEFTYRGKKLTVTDGDITDARFTDCNKVTKIIGLRFKIVVNKDNQNKLAFCIA